MQYDIKKIVSQFDIPADFVSAKPYGSGHINDTFAVDCDQGGAPVRYILQRINHDVFTAPVELMDNIKRVTEHQHSKLDLSCPHASRRALRLIHTNDESHFHRDAQGNHWRVYVFIEKAQTYDVIESPEQAFQAAKAFGKFQKELVDLPGAPLYESIPDFHNTPKRYQTLLTAIEADQCNRAATVKNEIEFAMARMDSAGLLLKLNAEGEMPTRVTHNDTKLNNVMIDDKTGEGICVIDLDTVMPGLSLYDFGDLVRSGTRSCLEDEQDLNNVRVLMPMFEKLVQGYLESAGEFLNATERQYLAFSGQLITLEIGVRFLTDFLQGDVYFKTHRDGHNLDRCRVQFRMVEELENVEDEMNQMVKLYT